MFTREPFKPKFDSGKPRNPLRYYKSEENKE